eukprot:1160745-Pelagomonas_calceolata.AAC.4
MDTEALVSQLDVAMESKQITPDDLVTFVKQVGMWARGDPHMALYADLKEAALGYTPTSSQV